MKILPSLLIALTTLACGAGVVVEPIGGAEMPGPSAPPSSNSPANPVTPSTPAPKAPISPYTPVVETTDVSILYPLPLKGESTDFVRPSEQGTYGPLLAPSSFLTALSQQHLDRAGRAAFSGYPELALVSLRLDPCSARGGTACTSEVRACSRPSTSVPQPRRTATRRSAPPRPMARSTSCTTCPSRSS